MDRAPVQVLSAGIVAAASIAYTVWVLGAGTHFAIWRPDDWSIILGRPDPSVSSWMDAFNGHWSTLLIVTYQTMLRTVGLADYTPWLVLVTSAHLAVVALLYATVARRAGPLIAVLSALFVLGFSQGSEDMFWSFQIGFLGALAFGLIALLLADGERWSTRRSGVTAGAMLGALTWSGVGLVMCIAASVPLIARRRWVPIVVAAGAYGLWTLGWSMAYGPREGDPLAYATRTFEIVGELFTGVGNFAAAPLAAAMTIAAVAGMLCGWRPPMLAVGALLGLVVLYGGVGLRGGFDPYFAEPSRYRYPALVLVLLAITTFRAPRFSAIGRTAIVAVMGLGATQAIGGLPRSAVAWEHESLVFLAQIAVIQDQPPPPGRDVRVEPFGLSADAILAATDRWGSIRIGDELRRRLAAHPYLGMAEEMRERVGTNGEP